MLDGTLETQAEAPKAVPANGTTANAHPFQTSWVVSLRTAYPGASGRGRLYWPATGVTLTAATMRPATSQVTTFLTGVKTYLSTIQANIDATLDGVALGVWSRKLQNVHVVNQLQAGDVLDVQRRRRDVLVEQVSSLGYP
jgi:hypothetical protein